MRDLHCQTICFPQEWTLIFHEHILVSSNIGPFIPKVMCVPCSKYMLIDDHNIVAAMFGWTWT